MKKVLFTIATAVMMFAATSCKKENINEPATEVLRDPAANEFLASIDGGGMVQNAPRVNDGMGTLATFDSQDKLKVMWQQEDVIYVNGTANAFTCKSDPKNSNRAYFENKTGFPTGYQADEYHAFYSTSVSPNANAASGTLSAIQYYNPENQAENLPMYAYSTDHWLNFSNICAAIKIYVPCTADHIVIKNTSAPMNGGFTVQSGTAVMDVAQLTDDHKKITIYKGTLGNTEAFHACDSLFIAIPAGTYQGFEIAFYENAGDANPIYTTGPSESGKNLTVTANKIYRIVGYKYPNHLLPGKFSVSATEKVQFTTGNMWREGSASPYRYHFENEQTDYPTTVSDDHTGHFTIPITNKKINDDNNEYDVLTRVEFDYLLKFTMDNLSSEFRDNAENLRSMAKVYTGNNNDFVYCLLVAPDGATAFNPGRHEYTLKEVNSMGLLCLPMAGLFKDGAVKKHSGAPAQTSGEIIARYRANGNSYECLNVQSRATDTPPISELAPSLNDNGVTIRLVKRLSTKPQE